MTPRKLNVLICTFSYGGNGGVAAEVPDIRDWLIWNIPKIEKDDRCHLIYPQPRKKVLDVADTPITMTRNRAVVAARELNADLLLMIDSDMAPDNRLGYPDAAPFWEEAFEFIYKRWERGPNVVGAPYCGPGPENIYVFKWSNQFSDDADEDFQIVPYERLEAAAMKGIQPVAALPTGLILYDTRIFELTEPSQLPRDAILAQFKDGQISRQEALRLLEPGWFYYEWSSPAAFQKGSTEDVTATRDMSVLGEMMLNYNPVHCAWDSWAGHWKPKCVGKPQMLAANEMGERYRTAAHRRSSQQRQMLQESKIAEELDWATASRPGTVDPEADTVVLNAEEDRPRWLKHSRVIGGRDIISWGFQTSEEDLGALRDLVTIAMPEKGTFLAAEIGSWVGESALTIANAAAPRQAYIWCIDTWMGSGTDQTAEIVAELGGADQLYKQFCDNTSPFRDPTATQRIRSFRTTSLEAAQSFSPKAFHLIFFDADHSDLDRDLEAWLPKLRPGGIACGHDYGDPQFPKVTRDAHAHGKVNNPPGTKIWWFRKPAEAAEEGSCEEVAE